MTRRTITDEGLEFVFKSDNRPRDLVMWHDVPEDERHWFDYVTSDEDRGTFRFFCFRGSWYDANEFEVAPARFKRLGFDGIQTSSYFDAVILRYFDRDGYAYDDQVVVGYVFW